MYFFSFIRSPHVWSASVRWLHVKFFVTCANAKGAIKFCIASVHVVFEIVFYAVGTSIHYMKTTLSIYLSISVFLEIFFVEILTFTYFSNLLACFLWVYLFYPNLKSSALFIRVYVDEVEFYMELWKCFELPLF